ncbi:HD domain-containing phosphohydrolase [Chloroflexota bacterium]
MPFLPLAICLLNVFLFGQLVLDSQVVLILYYQPQRYGIIKEEMKEIEQNHEQLQKALESIIWATAAIVEARDPYTAGHQQRVTNLSLVAANEMQLSEKKKQEIRMAAMVHDLGKVCVPSEILSKPGRLNSVEFSMIKMHSQVGHAIFRNVDLPWPIADILLQHHERLDGSGYPQNLKGENILMSARIIAVADVVEAMASHRPYRPALGIDKALEEISGKKGIFYDPDVVDAFLSLFKEKGLPIPQLPSDMSETIAQAIHEDYRKTQGDKVSDDDPSMAQWDKLTYHLKESSRQQAEHILKKLSRIGCTVHRVNNRDIRLMKFTDDEEKMMAEMEHQRWTAERLLDGWVFGEKRDVIKKTSPYLVPSSELPDDIRDLDRQMVLNIPELLAKVGMEIHRQSGSKGKITGKGDND